jgi:hypothetical protein
MLATVYTSFSYSLPILASVNVICCFYTIVPAIEFIVDICQTKGYRKPLTNDRFNTPDQANSRCCIMHIVVMNPVTVAA